MSVRSLVVGIVLGAALALTATAVAQAPAPPVPLVGPAPRPFGQVEIVRMNDRTAMAIKDLGDSQLVLVYSFDGAGKLMPTPQKLRFYYQ